MEKKNLHTFIFCEFAKVVLLGGSRGRLGDGGGRTKGRDNRNSGVVNEEVLATAF